MTHDETIAIQYRERQVVRYLTAIAKRVRVRDAELSSPIRTVQRWARRYAEQANAGLIDRRWLNRRGNPGKRSPKSKHST